MQKVLYIIAREYMTRVRKKSFIILTLLMPLLIGAFLVATVLIATNGKQETNILVKDDSNLFADKFRGLDDDNIHYDYLMNNTSLDALKKTYNEDYDILLYIPKIDLDRPNGITIYAEKELGGNIENTIEDALTEQIKNIVLLRENYNVELIDKLNQTVTIEKVINDKQQFGRSSLAGGIGYICGFLIYIFLLVYGSMVLKGVTEEKTNRIIEVLVTSVKPFQLMMGKIIGIGAVGLTQFVLWGILSFIVQFVVGLIFADQMTAMQSMQQSQASSSEVVSIMNDLSLAFKDLDIFRIIFSFIFYFIFGYFFYAAQFAAIGAAVTDDSDAQSFTFPLMIPIMISIVLMSVTLEQPFGAAAKWGSMLPFSSPIIMMSRIPFKVEWWQQIISMLILVVACIAITALAARIYRIGILIQGKKVSFKEIGKWIFMKV
ncbi:MAG: ABC transporter permease [Chitinophagales bacterium]|nr:ABC transporter permease [Chitinophagales bacterium]